MSNILITKSRLKELRITKSSYKHAQLEALGRPVIKGWFNALFHSVVTEEQYQKALELRRKTDEEQEVANAEKIRIRRERKKERDKKLKPIRAARRKKKIEKRRAKREEQRKKRSEARKQKKRKNSPWWKKYRKYLESKEWQDIRIDLFQNRGRKCEWCGSTHILQVHHLTYRNVFNEEPEDLVILCASCHKAEHK